MLARLLRPRTPLAGPAASLCVRVPLIDALLSRDRSTRAFFPPHPGFESLARRCVWFFRPCVQARALSSSLPDSKSLPYVKQMFFGRVAVKEVR